MRKALIIAAGIILALIMGLLLWRWSAPADADRGLHGGPMFSFAAERIAHIDIHRPDRRHQLVRDPDTGHWRLEGDVADLVNQKGMATTLATMLDGEAFPVLPGTEPDERRFGFGGDDSLELVFVLDGGARHRVALGDVAPVSDQVYASGLSRAGVFGVGGRFYAAAAGLPDAVRLATLLPTLRAEQLEALTLARRGAASLVFRRDAAGRWWLRDDVELSGLAARYQARFADRRTEVAGSTWSLASTRRLANLVHAISATAVTGFVPPAQATAAWLDAAGLADPYRSVTLTSTGATHHVDLGEVQDQDALVARRDGAVVITRGEALRPCEGPVSDYLDLTALGYSLLGADSLHIDEGDQPLLWGVRADDPRARFLERRSPWDVSSPPGFSPRRPLETLANQTHDIQVYLDRLAMVDLLPDAREMPLRRGDGVWRVSAWFAGEDAPRQVWLGWHVGTGRPAVWERRSGRVVAVDEEILVSLRSLRGGWG